MSHALPAAAGPLHFDAVLTPHRSLGPTGFRVLMAVVIAVSLVLGVAFLTLGAWPVFGFLGLDVAAVYLAFRLSYRSGRLAERVQLSDGELLVRRISPRGQEARWSFQPYWVRLSLPDPDRHDSQLVISSHGRSVVVGSFLSPAERSEFATALSAALRQRGQPSEPSPSTSAMP